MACDCTTSDCGCDTLDVPLGPRGLAGPPGITPRLIFSVATLPAGSSATVSQTGGPASYDIILGIPAGATGAGNPGINGTNGLNAFTTLTAAFTQPALSGIATISVVDNSWVEPDQWIYIPGGGYYIVVTPVGSTTIQIRNPGPAQGFPSGVTGNASPATNIGGNGTGVTPGGIPGNAGATGETGENGDTGADAELLVVNTVPVSAPAPGRSTVVVTDSATTPTFTVLYTWNGSAWAQTANIQGAAGSQIINTPGDPNVTLPGGDLGDYAVRTDVPSMYVKTGVSTWTSVVSLTPTFEQVATESGGDFGTVPGYTQAIIGFEDQTYNHNSVGTFTFDNAVQSSVVLADKDIELDWDDTGYTENGNWLWQITNTDASPINVTYATGQFAKDTGLSLPSTLAASATQVYHLVRQGSRMLITNTYVSVNV